MRQREGNQCENKPIFSSTSNYRLTDKQNRENYESVKLTRRLCRYQKNKAKEKMKVDIMDRKSYFRKFCFHCEKSVFFFTFFVLFLFCNFFDWYLPSLLQHYRLLCTNKRKHGLPRSIFVYLFINVCLFFLLFSIMSLYNSLSRRMFKCSLCFSWTEICHTKC